MKRIIIHALITAIILTTNAQNQQLPNVLIVVADDLGWNDVSFHGSEIQTPQIDALANESIVLNRFYVSPVCTPTRAGLMTGKYPNRFGLRYGVCSPRSINGLPAEEKTIANWFDELGYLNRAAFGKWHLGHSNVKYHPLSRGFNYFYGHYNGAIDYFTHKRDGQLDWHRNFDPVTEAGYSTDLITSDVINYIKEVKHEGPFLAYVAYNAPHSPMQAKLEELKKYGFDEEVGAKDNYPIGGQQPGEQEQGIYGMIGRGNDLRQTYSAMVSSLDEGFGKLIEYLKAEGLYENTLIWFLSDNGGTYRFGGDNKPLRGQKHQEYEGGVRSVSFIKPNNFHGPQKIVDHITGYIDILPTLVSMIGGNSLDTLDGIDITSIINGQDTPERLFYLGNSALVSKEWKLVEGALYNLLQDPYETTDVAPYYPAKYIELKQLAGEFESITVGDYEYQPDEWTPPLNWSMEE